MMQPEFLHPSSLDEDGFLFGLDMDSFMDNFEFSSSFTITEDSSDVSSIPHCPTMYFDELLTFPVCGDAVPVISSMEFIDWEEFGSVFNNQSLADTSRSMDESQSREEEGGMSLSRSMNTAWVQPLLDLPTEEMEIDNQLSIFHLLKAYGETMEMEQAELADVTSKRIREKGSPIGATIERFAYYFFQETDDETTYLEQESSRNYEAAFRAFYQIFPYGRFAHFTANSAILKAMPENVEVVHVVDFDMGEGIQWPPLIEAIGRQRITLQLTSIKWKDDTQLRFEETKRWLCDHAQSIGLKLQVEEMEMEELVSEMKKMKKRGGGRDWLAFNCMVCLPHMGRQRRSRRDVMEFIRVAQELIKPSSSSNDCRGVLTFGDNGGNIEDRMRDYCCGFGSFFDDYLLHYHALFESMECSFPCHLTEARTAMECLFVGPNVSSLTCFQKWEEIREVCDGHLRFGLEGWRLSREALVDAKEMVKEGESQYRVRVEGENGNEMILEWRGTPLVRVCAWR